MSHHYPATWNVLKFECWKTVGFLSLTSFWTKLPNKKQQLVVHTYNLATQRRLGRSRFEDSPCKKFMRTHLNQ
jgi:hypothetical protein